MLPVFLAVDLYHICTQQVSVLMIADLSPITVAGRTSDWIDQLLLRLRGSLLGCHNERVENSLLF